MSCFFLELEVRKMLMSTGRYYHHLDGSTVCKICECSPEEGCTHVKAALREARKAKRV